VSLHIQLEIKSAVVADIWITRIAEHEDGTRDYSVRASRAGAHQVTKILGFDPNDGALELAMRALEQAKTLPSPLSPLPKSSG
jgi:hypothetical protein